MPIRNLQVGATQGPSPSFNDIPKEFIKIVIASPVAIVTLVLSAFFGYGISFIVFDYRKSKVKKSHYLFHVTIGLGYAAVIFSIVNFDILSRRLTMDQMSQRMPLTLLISFAVSFVLMMAGAVWRQRSGGRTG